MGAQGHGVIGYIPRPNQAKMWSYQWMAHGCSSLMYFRYREATKGAEPFFENNVNIDVIPSHVSFDEYQVLLLPVKIVYKKEVQEKIREFVRQEKLYY